MSRKGWGRIKSASDLQRDKKDSVNTPPGLRNPTDVRPAGTGGGGKKKLADIQVPSNEQPGERSAVKLDRSPDSREEMGEPTTAQRRGTTYISRLRGI